MTSYYIIVSSDLTPTGIVSEHTSFNDASAKLLRLFNSLYGCHCIDWSDALKSDLSHKIFVWELNYEVTCFQFRERYYDICFKANSKIKGSSLSPDFFT